MSVVAYAKGQCSIEDIVKSKRDIQREKESLNLSNALFEPTCVACLLGEIISYSPSFAAGQLCSPDTASSGWAANRGPAKLVHIVRKRTFTDTPAALHEVIRTFSGRHKIAQHRAGHRSGAVHSGLRCTMLKLSKSAKTNE